MTITLYTTSTCPHCQKERTYLAEHGLTATEIILDQTKDQLEAFAKASSGFCGVPFTLVTADDGNIETVQGFNKQKLDTLLGFLEHQDVPSTQQVDQAQTEGDQTASPSPLQATQPLDTPEEQTSSMPVGGLPSSDGFGTMSTAAAASA